MLLGGDNLFSRALGLIESQHNHLARRPQPALAHLGDFLEPVPQIERFAHAPLQGKLPIAYRSQKVDRLIIIAALTNRFRRQVHL